MRSVVFQIRFDDMDFLREGGSVQRPPLLDGTNYSYWKARMKAFIKSVDEKAWKAILTGWDHPMTRNDKRESVLKPEVEWTANEDNSWRITTLKP